MKSVRISIIIPSKLSLFKNCALDRETKFICAIQSCLLQTFQDFEIIILGDACDITERIYKEKYSHNEKIRFIQCVTQGMTWQRVSILRNYGIDKAKGEFITYLDTDDVLGKNHLQILNDELKAYDWIWYDEYFADKNLQCSLNQCSLIFGKIGTCNITHKRELPVRWSGKTYKHDFEFVQALMKFNNFNKAATPEYIICHQPEKFDV